jgi:hypothetical protein
LQPPAPASPPGLFLGLLIRLLTKLRACRAKACYQVLDFMVLPLKQDYCYKFGDGEIGLFRATVLVAT